MDSIWNGWIPWIPYGLFFGWQPSHFSIPYPLWIHVDSMEFPMNLHCKSMYYSIWIPWNSPHGIPWKDTNQCIVKNSVNIKNQTLDFATHHVHKQASNLTTTLYDRWYLINHPHLMLLWARDAQIKHRQTPMLDLDAINNQQHSSSPPPPSTMAAHDTDDTASSDNDDAWRHHHRW